MTTFTAIRPLVATETERLAPTLYEAVAHGVDGARTRMRGLDLSRYPAQFSGLVRVEVREDLETRALPDGWSISGNPRQMAELLLENKEHNIAFRFLKENRANVGRVPHAGHNRARQREWSQHDTPLTLDFGVGGPTLSLAEPTKFLLLWAPVDPADLDAGFTLRVVHPIEKGGHLRGVQCDMEIELLNDGGILDRMAFLGSDEAGDLFQVDAEESSDE